MKAFHTIAIPHQDILRGRLTMEVFAADLGEVSQQRGPDEYKDAETFFQKTYLTQGLKNLLSIVEKRLTGAGGDPVIQIQTPFGGGKTHALIALYHKAAEWQANKVVVVGTNLSTEETLWGLIEKQLIGKMVKFTGKVSPGKEAIRALLSAHQPVLILMDELLEYATKAAGVKVAESSLAAQTMAFMQELTETAGILEKVCLVVTLPSSLVEHYDEAAERLYQQLQKIAGRVEKIYTPVQEDEITRIIRRRLFSTVQEQAAKEVVGAFLAYAEKEGLLPAGVAPSEYRSRLLDAYPFLPEVVDVLYHRWGSFPTFQRTRGVLRLLSLVIHSQKDTGKSYLSLADFDLANQEIRQELLKHIGAEFNSVIASDLTDVEAGAKKVDVSLGGAYQGLKLGSRTATSIFLYSFSGGPERGITLSEIKRTATTLENPSSVVAEAVEQLKTKLFYLQNIGEKYFFSNQPNLNRIRLTKMENIPESVLVEEERKLLKEHIQGGRLKVFLWKEQTGDITDSEELKLVILQRENREVMDALLTTKGQTPRVYRNTLFFLYPLESERSAFLQTLKRQLADAAIEQDTTLNLSEEQKKEIKRDLKKREPEIKESMRRLYRLVALPGKDGWKEVDLGIPTFGEEKKLDQEVYEKLRSDGEILEKILPIVIKEKYLSGKTFVSTEQLYQASYKTPGEPRPASRDIWEQGIMEGVRMGIFGLGELEGDTPICQYFKEQASVAFSGNEVLISEALCREQRKKAEPPETAPLPYPPATVTESPQIQEAQQPAETEESSAPSSRTKATLQLKFRIPKGKVSGIMGVMNPLQSKFQTLELELTATGGEISEQEYEDKIQETFRQLGIEVEEG